MDGWWDSPEIKGDTADRPYADGEFDLPTYNQARLITVSGNLHAAGHQQLHDAMNSLTGPLSGRFQVAGHGAPIWAECKRNSGVKFTPVTDTFAQWQVRLKAVDPRKYGASTDFVAASGAPVEVFHRGNYGATPKFLIAGDMPGGYTLTVDGWDFTVSRAKVSGLNHRVDYNNGRLYVDGVLMSNALGNTNVTTVPPGKSVGFGLYPTAGGTGTATMTLVDTYI